MKKNPTERLCVFANDVALITGRSYKTSLRILRDIREFYGKPQKAIITYVEFCAYMNLDESEVLDRLR